MKKDKAKHFDDNKVTLQNILAMSGLDEVANVGQYGAKKYGLWNFMKGAEWMRYLGSCARHIAAVIRGEWLDLESGLPHLAHCAFNCLIILTWHQTGKGTDDRPNCK